MNVKLVINKDDIRKDEHGEPFIFYKVKWHYALSLIFLRKVLIRFKNFKFDGDIQK